MRIFKYRLALHGDTDVYVPHGARFLSVGLDQKARPAAYFEVDPEVDEGESLHQFVSLRTGEDVPDNLPDGGFLGTVAMAIDPTAAFIVHVYGWHDRRPA